MKNKEYISLKEASEISGYSPDYVGQLIRGGKLPGKQIFQQVAWVTTEEDLKSYMEHKQVGASIKTAGRAGERKGSISGKKRSFEVPRIATQVLYATAAATVVLFLVLFFIFSSSVEHRLNEAAIQQSESMSSQ